MRGAAPAPAAAAAMPILVKAAAGAGARHPPRSLATHQSAEAFASGSRRAAATVSSAPHRCCPKLWPSRTRLGARDKPGKEREAQPAAPASLAICSNALLGAKSGSESWIPALLGATLAAPAAAASSLRLGHREPRLLLAGRTLSGFPVLGSRPSPRVWVPRPHTFKCQLPQLGSGSANVPGARPPSDRFPRSASGKPGQLRLSFPRWTPGAHYPRTHYGSSFPL